MRKRRPIRDPEKLDRLRVAPGQKVVLDANVFLDEVEKQARQQSDRVLQCVITTCCRACWSPALQQEVEGNAPKRFSRAGMLHLLAGSVEKAKGTLDLRNKLVSNESVAQRGGWSHADAGLSSSQSKYVEVGDRHLFVLARREAARLVVTTDQRILSGHARLGPHHECAAPEWFVRANTRMP